MIIVDSVRTMQFNSASIRCISLDGQPWLIAADVMKCIGVQNCTTAVASLREHECRKVSLFEAPQQHALSVKGVQKKLNRSRKPEASALLDWIQREAIPAFTEASKQPAPDSVQRLTARIAQLERQLSVVA
jgi:prophage antirepressor-like protein